MWIGIQTEGTVYTVRDSLPQEISIWITHHQKFCRCSKWLKELCANDFDSLHHSIGEPGVVPCPDPEGVPVSQ